MAVQGGDGKRAERTTRHTVITGGCGFLGSHLARRLANDGRRVRLLDNLSRPGADDNLDALRREFPGGEIAFQLADVRDAWAVEKAVRGAEAVFHLAALPTSPVTGPVEDFEVNAQGTLNVLEALRALPAAPPLVFASSCQVYGELDDVELRLVDGRWCPAGAAAELGVHGVPESRPVDGYGPHGCSKAAADQYVRDYARSFGLPAVVLRLSGVYGPGQSNGFSAGWLSQLLGSALGGGPVKLPGDGHQVRDLLYVDDVVEALLAAEACARRLAGHAFNLGGGPDNACSARDLIATLAALRGAELEIRESGWMAGEPRFFVADLRRFQAETGWRPSVGLDEGLGRLCDGAWAEPDAAARQRPRRESHVEEVFTPGGLTPAPA